MTRYEVGFMNKCAEYGVDVGTAVRLMEKKALSPRNIRKLFFNILPEVGKPGADRIISRVNLTLRNSRNLPWQVRQNLGEIADIAESAKALVGKHGDGINVLDLARSLSKPSEHTHFMTNYLLRSK